MAYSIIQSGDAIQFMDSDGLITDLTLPSNVTISANEYPRFVIYDNYVVMVNSPNLPLTIDGLGTVRPLTPIAPTVAPIVSAGAAGGLTGTYAGIRVTFIIKNSDGQVISESDFSPASNSIAIAAQNLKVTGIPTSTETITARRLYRPTTLGTTLYPWLDVDGNTITEVQDDLADAALSLVAAPLLGYPQHLTLIKEWRNRLWGVNDSSIDDIFYSEADAFYAWPVDNNIGVPGAGRDKFGIRSLMPRREALGIGRRDVIWQLTGETPDDFRLVKLSENTGVESNESMTIYRDIVLWLWKDGVYQWDSEGLKNVSDMGGVSSWFNSPDYFNQDMFQYAFAVFDPTRYKYRLYLASAGSNVINRWVEYDLTTKTWWGPHKTVAFNPSSAFVIADDADKTSSVVGSSSGYVWDEQDTPSDDTLGIDIDIDTKSFDGSAADLEKYWGELSMIGKAQTSGTLKVTPSVGYITTTTSPSFAYDMTKGRERLQRLGMGKFLKFNFKHSKAGEPVELYGYQLPYHIIGRR